MDIFGLNVIDVVIVLLILCGGVVGFKRGVFKELVMTVGYILLIIISLVLKNPLAEFLSLHLPFFNFTGTTFEGVVVLNILLYQLVAFIIVFALLSIIFNVILSVTKVLEKFLDLTIVLGVVSKILGLIVGLIEGYIIVFFICFILSYPVFNQNVVASSTLRARIVDSTPVLSSLCKAMSETVDEIVELAETDVVDETNEFNLQTIDIMLKHELIEVDYVQKLVDAGKIDITGIDTILANYQ